MRGVPPNRQQSRLLLWAVAIIVPALMAVFGGTQHNKQKASASLLPVTFAHTDHTAHNCVACHHNFTDNTGQGFCFDCHKTDPNIAPHIEPMFHGLCQDCHVQLALDGEPHGPVRACQQCHLADMAP